MIFIFIYLNFFFLGEGGGRGGEYPDGNKDINGSGHISLYLAISDTTSLLECWQEVNVQSKLFVYDHIRHNYLTIQGKVKEYIRKLCYHVIFILS